MKTKFENLKEKIKGLFTDPQWQALKRVGRFIFFLLVSEASTQMLDQIAKVPDFMFFNVWVFRFAIAFRASLRMALTLVLTYIDTKKHKDWKLLHPRSEKSGGLIKW